MDDYARRNLKDFLSMYNQFTELCFNHCIQNFNYRHMVPEEAACANRCAEKLINVNHRLITTYMEVNPLHKKAAALEAGQADAPQKPPNLAGQVQEVFGPDTVVTDGSAGIVAPQLPEVDSSQTADGQGSVTQEIGLSGHAESESQTLESEIKAGAVAATS